MAGAQNRECELGQQELLHQGAGEARLDQPNGEEESGPLQAGHGWHRVRHHQHHFAPDHNAPDHNHAAGDDHFAPDHHHPANDNHSSDHDDSANHHDSSAASAPSRDATPERKLSDLRFRFELELPRSAGRQPGDLAR